MRAMLSLGASACVHTQQWALLLVDLCCLGLARGAYACELRVVVECDGYGGTVQGPSCRIRPGC
jgi:hypothetical protein